MTETRMSLQEYARHIGRENLTRVLDLTGISLNYWRLVAGNYKSCTPEFFERIEAAIEQVTPGIRPDYEVCTRPSMLTRRREAKIFARAAAAAAEAEYLQNRVSAQANETAGAAA